MPAANPHKVQPFVRFAALCLAIAFAILATPNSVAASPSNAGQVLQTIGTAANPQDIAISPDGKYAYVTTLDGANVDVVDLISLALERSIQLSMPGGAVKTFDDGSALLITNFTNNVLLEVDPASGQLERTINTAAGPISLATIPGSHRVLVANNGANSVSVIDTDQGSSDMIPLGGKPWGIGISPNGSTAYAVIQSSNSVAIIDIPSRSVIGSVAVGARPAYLAVSADGSKVFVTNANGATVSAIDTSTETVVATYAVGGKPWGVANSPDGKYVYVCDNKGGSLSTIDVGSGQVIGTVPAGTNPDFVATSNDGALVLVANSKSNTVTVMRGYSDPPAPTPTTSASPTSENSSNDGRHESTSSRGFTGWPWIIAGVIGLLVLGGVAFAVLMLVRAKRPAGQATLVGSPIASPPEPAWSAVPSLAQELMGEAADPNTPAQRLADLAQHGQDYWPAIAANPAAYPELLHWLAERGDPATNRALQLRNAPR